MTVIAGLIDKGRVYIGGDSAAVSETDVQIRADKKVFRAGEYLIGFAGSWRFGQLLQYNFVPPSNRDPDPFAHMVRRIVPAIRSATNEAGEDDTAALLVGFDGRLYRIDTDYQVAEPLFGYDAIGEGAAYALGSLFGDGRPPALRVEFALAAAEEFCSSVRGPLYVEHLGAANDNAREAA